MPDEKNKEKPERSKDREKSVAAGAGDTTRASFLLDEAAQWNTENYLDPEIFERHGLRIKEKDGFKGDNYLPHYFPLSFRVFDRNGMQIAELIIREPIESVYNEDTQKDEYVDRDVPKYKVIYDSLNSETNFASDDLTEICNDIEKTAKKMESATQELGETMMRDMESLTRDNALPKGFAAMMNNDVLEISYESKKFATVHVINSRLLRNSDKSERTASPLTYIVDIPLRAHDVYIADNIADVDQYLNVINNHLTIRKAFLKPDRVLDFSISDVEVGNWTIWLPLIKPGKIEILMTKDPSRAKTTRYLNLRLVFNDASPRPYEIHADVNNVLFERCFAMLEVKKFLRDNP